MCGRYVSAAVKLHRMTSLAHIRTAVKRFVEVERSTRLDVESWSVAGQEFLAVTTDRAAIEIRLPPDDARNVLTDIPGSSLLVHEGATLGVTIPLDAMNGMQANAVIGRAWAHRAPQHLVTVAEEAAARASDLPQDLGRPATSALQQAGIATLTELATHTEAEIAALHGIGPKAIRRLTAALTDQKLTWAAR